MEPGEECAARGVVHVPEAGDDHRHARCEEGAGHAANALETRALTRCRAAASEDDQPGSLETVRGDLVGAQDAAHAGVSIRCEQQASAAGNVALKSVASVVHD